MLINKLKLKHAWLGGTICLVVILFFVVVQGLYPIARVGGELVSAHELRESYNYAKKLDPTATKEQVLNQVVKINQEEQLLRDLKISRDNAVENELKFYRAGNSDQYQKFLNDYFNGNEKKFTSYVVKTQVFDVLLHIKYNSDYAANNNAYNRAENVIDKLSQGQNFEDLAKEYSDDKITGQLGGDLGFVKSGQILPELEQVLNVSTIGEVRKQIVASRLGYHILYPVEVAQIDGEKVWHVRHILIQTTGYEDWLSQKLQTVGVNRFISI